MSISRSKPPKTFLASIKERLRLNPGSEKETYHIVLDIEGSGIVYSVGDCIGVYPENDPNYVQKLVDAAQDTSLHSFFLKEANLNRIPKKILGEYPHLLAVLAQKQVSPDDLRDKLLPLLPRFYSIASSSSHVGQEVHLTVALTKNPPDSSYPYGTCSDFLCRRAPLLSPVVPIFLQPSAHFFLPPESQHKPLIMIGPGTGIAPFRGFMQEREHNENWLFFGERHEKTDYYYRSFWEKHCVEGRLRVECAFSRDQEERIYVQDKMYAHAKEVWRWLEKGAYIFVCGDASRMAKDVDKILHHIVEKEGSCTPQEAKLYIKNLKRNNRYLRDVY